MAKDEDGFDVDVTERNEGFEIGIDGNLVNVFLLLHAFGSGGNAGQNRGTRQRERDSDGQDDDGGGISLVHRLRRQGRILLGRSGRRQRQREASGGER
ncbi:hypothetical protein Acr_10g0001410 [Actinidia rufa]|uniref:Uncharacterized protein n=1 Tax=Actinidia rufa TaxID=165716 RepID=A0A7J0F8N4_9ERIC|nr:hypothetical protein Acr_10g0001410 [Actinidia rufa]